MAELCQRDLDGLGMPDKWAICIVDSIIKGKDDNRNSSFHRAVTHPEHGRKVLEKVLQIRFCRIVTGIEMQFGSMTEKRTIDGVLILRKEQLMVC